MAMRECLSTSTCQTKAWTASYSIRIKISYCHGVSVLASFWGSREDYFTSIKIPDFGLARIFGGEQTEEKTKRVIGTYGYMSPEYAMSGHFSVKSDVFSYGVIVLETITGKKNWGFYHPDHDYNLIGHTWKLWNEKNCSELLDTIYLEDSVSVERCIQVALLCVQQRHEDRPTMSSVVFMLNNESAEVPQPKQPGFFVEISQNTPASGSGSCSGPYSKNDMTITVEDGR